MIVKIDVNVGDGSRDKFLESIFGVSGTESASGPETPAPSSAWFVQLAAAIAAWSAGVCLVDPRSTPLLHSLDDVPRARTNKHCSSKRAQDVVQTSRLFLCRLSVPQVWKKKRPSIYLTCSIRFR
jgi:hypothetical protein